MLTSLTAIFRELQKHLYRDLPRLELAIDEVSTQLAIFLRCLLIAFDNYLALVRDSSSFGNQMEAVAAFGVATGVIGLVPLCADGFNFIATVFTAKEDLAECELELDAETSKYLAWKTTLGLDGIPEKQAAELLKSRIPVGQHRVVLKHLVAISNTFANASFLERCGLRKTKNDVRKSQASPECNVVN